MKNNNKKHLSYFNCCLVEGSARNLWTLPCSIGEFYCTPAPCCPGSVQFSSVQSLYRMGRRGDMRDNSAEILFQIFLQEALVGSSGMGRDVHSLMLSIQHFICWPQRRPFSRVPWMMVLQRLSWRVTCPNHASFRLLTATRRDSCGPTRTLILLRIQSLVLCSK